MCSWSKPLQHLHQFGMASSTTSSDLTKALQCSKEAKWWRPKYNHRNTVEERHNNSRFFCTVAHLSTKDHVLTPQPSNHHQPATTSSTTSATTSQLEYGTCNAHVIVMLKPQTARATELRPDTRKPPHKRPPAPRVQRGVIATRQGSPGLTALQGYPSYVYIILHIQFSTYVYTVEMQQ